MMRFYNQSHRFYCGVDLHARTMYLCILDQAGAVVLHQEVSAEPSAFLEAIAPFRNDLVVACECLFCWYWLADLCQAENIVFVLGHALYMKAIHGGKSADDRIDQDLILRETETLKEVSRFSLPSQEAVIGLSFSPNGTLLGGARQHADLILWDVKERKEKCRLG